MHLVELLRRRVERSLVCRGVAQSFHKRRKKGCATHMALPTNGDQRVCTRVHQCNRMVWLRFHIFRGFATCRRGGMVIVHKATQRAPPLSDQWRCNMCPLLILYTTRPPRRHRHLADVCGHVTSLRHLTSNPELGIAARFYFRQ